MPIFTSLGLALGASAAAATSVGIGASLLATGVGVAAFGAGGGFKDKDSAIGDSRVGASEGTGQLSTAEAQAASKKRAFRSGILFTSPTGLGTQPSTSSSKLR